MKVRVLIFIILAQFAATSVWFAGNAIYPDIREAYQIESAITPLLTIAVQLGFILGTFSYALAMIPDRFSPSGVFLISALLAAAFNLMIIVPLSVWILFLARFGVGFFLAGIYPVGMKIAADWFKSSLGNALGFLVGALVLGTGFPHLIKAASVGLPWTFVVVVTSCMAVLGGLSIYFFVGNGPDRKKGKQFNPSVFTIMFRDQKFRSAAFGYFGHMWELYTFWAFVPLIITLYNEFNDTHLPVSLWSFIIIAIGFIGSSLGGIMSKSIGSRRVAFISLLISGTCCALSFLFFQIPHFLFLFSMGVWGFFVIADSPQFSSLVAKYANPESIGSALTLVNSIGFAVTIVSIQLVSQLEYLGIYRYIALLPGPLFGLWQFGFKEKAATVN